MWRAPEKHVLSKSRLKFFNRLFCYIVEINKLTRSVKCRTVFYGLKWNKNYKLGRLASPTEAFCECSESANSAKIVVIAEKEAKIKAIGGMYRALQHFDRFNMGLEKYWALFCGKRIKKKVPIRCLAYRAFVHVKIDDNAKKGKKQGSWQR